MASHIKFIYENGSSYYLTMLLNAESIGDLLNKSEYVNALASYDQERLENFILTRQMVELLKAELEIDKQYLEEAKAAVEIEQNNLETLIAQKSNEIISYENNIANKEQAIKEYEAEQAAQDELIAATEAAIAEGNNHVIHSLNQHWILFGKPK